MRYAGFFVGNIGSVHLENEFNERCSRASFYYEEMFCARNALNTFSGEKAFCDDAYAKNNNRVHSAAIVS